ncbi:MAG: glutamine amidotransferase [Sphingorhabdus sp.]|uniref:glutamine amidotransferase n=1 Tax=Sphingorhabdus sp. TaxID=1902408 RepID=UPI003C9CA64F
MSKLAVAVRHATFEDLGTFRSTLTANGYRVQYLDAGCDQLTAALQADLVVFLGGPISANDEARYPCVRHEIELIERMLAASVPMLGICLGAQLIARAMGARVYAAEVKEIGFAAIELTEAGASSPLSALAGGPVLHWHGETFDLPPGASLLASTAICENQAFSIGNRVMACQFHPEACDGRFERWLIGHHGELVSEGVDIASLRAAELRERDALQLRSHAFLDAWLEQLV